MPAHLRLTSAQLELVDAYVASLQAVGIQRDPKAVWPARAFGARVGSPQAWADLSPWRPSARCPCASATSSAG
jgi:hypothetical protein